jgi:hypothetical protein
VLKLDVLTADTENGVNGEIKHDRSLILHIDFVSRTEKLQAEIVLDSS